MKREHDWEYVLLGWTCRHCGRWMDRTGHVFEAIDRTGGEHVELFAGLEVCGGGP